MTLIRRILPAALQPAGQTTVASRLATCRACPELKTVPIERCGKCGCVIAAKIRSQRASCPLGKW